MVLLKNNLRGVQHLGIPVIDIVQAKRWYTEIIGFKVIYETVIHPQAGSIKVAFLNLEDIVLELYQLPQEELEDIKTRGNGHIDHFAVRVFDIIDALCEVLSKGGMLDSSTPNGPIFVKGLWPKGIKYVNLIGPTGERVQLEQRLDLKSFNKKSNIDGWSHLGIVVSNIEISKKFYEKFGFREVTKAKIKDKGNIIKVSILEKCRFRIKLIQPIGKELEEVKLRKDGHIDHIAFDVVDIEKAFEELKQSGINITQENPIFLPLWERGIKYFDILGPDGEKIEFSEKL